MKTILLTGLGLLLASPAMAGFQGGSAPGGFVGPSSGVAQSVEQALGARGDTPAILEGHVVERVGKDKYVFQDATGKITVEIDHKVFGARIVTPQTRVRLSGEVDSEFFRRNEVDVDVLEILDQPSQ